MNDGLKERWTGDVTQRLSQLTWNQLPFESVHSNPTICEYSGFLAGAYYTNFIGWNITNVQKKIQ